MRAPMSIALALVAVPVAAQQHCEAGSTVASSPSSRFEDHRDGTVTDRVTRLMWMRCAQGQSFRDGHCLGSASRHDWTGAQDEAREVNRRGQHFYSDWRVPLLRELASIAERRCGNPRINLEQFPGTPAAPFWTATARPGAYAERQAFELSFGAEGAAFADKSEAVHVRLVRSAD